MLLLVDGDGVVDGDGGWGLMGGLARFDYRETIQKLSGNLGWRVWTGKGGLGWLGWAGPR